MLGDTSGTFNRKWQKKLKILLSVNVHIIKIAVVYFLKTPRLEFALNTPVYVKIP